MSETASIPGPAEWLASRAEQAPDRIALVAGGDTLSYAELAAAVRDEGQRLAEEGIGKGDAAVISLDAGFEYAVRLYALASLSAVACPLDPRLGEEEGAQPETARRAGPDPIACRILTSGTTGSPLAVGLTHGNLLWSAAGTGMALGVEPDDRWLCCVPLFHVSGLMILVRSLVYGTTAEIQDGFDTDAVAAAFADGKVTLVSLVATQLTRLLEAGADLSRLRAIVMGGGPTPVELLEEAIGRGATVVQTYGMTETTSQVATLAPADARRKLGSAGRPLLSAEIRIEEDEILVRGPAVAPGASSEDGWLRTGDLGRLDDDGFLYVTGRRSELIISGGENVMPGEVEAVLLRHPDVDDVAVVGRPDPEWQEMVTAIVVARGGAAPTPEDLRRHCAESLASFKVPKRFEFTDRLPRSPSGGKLLRAQLSG